MRLPAAAVGLALCLALPARDVRAETVDEDLVPGGVVLSTILPSSEVETYRVQAPAGSVLKVDLRPGRGGLLLPSLEADLSDGTPASLPPLRRSGRWRARLPFPVEGTLVLRIGSSAGPGEYRLRTKLRLPSGKAPRGPDEDHRDVSDPGALEGSYAALFGLGGEVLLPGFLTGSVDFDGEGRLDASLDTRGLVPDEGSPFGFTFLAGDPEGRRGSYFTDGTRATVSLEAGATGRVEADLAVAAGGSILHADPAGGGSALGLLLRREASLSTADLAGTWFYSSLVLGEGGASTLEAGVLTLSTAGGASGIGASTEVTLDEGGTPVPGAQTPVLRLGTFAVATDGTVTITTRANLFGPEEDWTARAVFRADILAGGGPAVSPASALRLLLRQGTGLTDADVSGDYLHLGIAAGAATSIRTGVLAFDGAGAFSGTETVTPLGGGTPEIGVPASGTYSVNAQGIATLAFDGGASGTGIAGPDAAYLFAFSLGTGGLGIDLLLDLGN